MEHIERFFFDAMVIEGHKKNNHLGNIHRVLWGIGNFKIEFSSKMLDRERVK